MAGAPIEATLELWASELRGAKARMQCLFTQERVAASAGLFLDGLLGPERRKTGWMRAASRARRDGRVTPDRGASRPFSAAASGRRMRCAT